MKKVVQSGSGYAGLSKSGKFYLAGLSKKSVGMKQGSSTDKAPIEHT
jgi:hypothetical protein